VDAHVNSYPLKSIENPCPCRVSQQWPINQSKGRCFKFESARGILGTRISLWLWTTSGMDQSARCVHSRWYNGNCQL